MGLGQEALGENPAVQEANSAIQAVEAGSSGIPGFTGEEMELEGFLARSDLAARADRTSFSRAVRSCAPKSAVGALPARNSASMQLRG